MTKFKVNHTVFICSQSSAIGMRNFKHTLDKLFIFILIAQRVYSVVIAKTEVRETYACYKYTYLSI